MHIGRISVSAEPKLPPHAQAQLQIMSGRSVSRTYIRRAYFLRVEIESEQLCGIVCSGRIICAVRLSRCTYIPSCLRISAAGTKLLNRCNSAKLRDFRVFLLIYYVLYSCDLWAIEFLKLNQNEFSRHSWQNFVNLMPYKYSLFVFDESSYAVYKRFQRIPHVITYIYR